MNKYKISLRYETGNSFHSEEVTDFLDPVWENLDIAKENLRRIKEHYEQYIALNDCRSKGDALGILKSNMDKDWFVYVPKPYYIKHNNPITENQKMMLNPDDWENRPDEFMAECTLRLKLDNGNDFQMTPYWMGQFESLREAEIIPDNTDMKITF